MSDLKWSIIFVEELCMYWLIDDMPRFLSQSTITAQCSFAIYKETHKTDMYTLILICEGWLLAQTPLLWLLLRDWKSVVFWTKVRSTQTCYSKWWLWPSKNGESQPSNTQQTFNMLSSNVIVCFCEDMHTADTKWVAELKLEQIFSM